MEELSIVQKIAVWALPVLLAITVHEAAHGWVAKIRGDSTAMMLGRVTLNPIKHIDPLGTIVLPLVMLWIGGFVFGWAKPVPINWQNLKNPKRDMALVAFAGPGANLIMAVLWALVMRLGLEINPSFDMLGMPLIYMGAAGILINVVLFVLNLLPIPPLDGGRIITSFLPGPWAWQVNKIEPFGLFILIGFMAMGWLGLILGPPINSIQTALYQLFGL